VAVAADTTGRLTEMSEHEACDDEVDVAVEKRSNEEDLSAAEPQARSVVTQRPSAFRAALLFGLATVVALGSLAGWLGYRGYQSEQAEHERQLFLSVGRKGVLNLTTIDFNHVDADIQRVLDSSTGAFEADFRERAEAFAEVVKQAQSKTEGTVVEAGLESRDGDTAQVLVAVSVKTSNAGVVEQKPRHWRMRVTVERSGDHAKVSNVGFVQ
jgi:Mce-associated membrane protein